MYSQYKISLLLGGYIAYDPIVGNYENLNII